MRVVVDTNVLISALLSGRSPPAQIVTLWREGRFALLTSQEQLDELARVTRYPKIRERLSPALAGRLVNELRDVAELGVLPVGIRALASNPLPTEKRNEGQKDIAVQIQGVWVRPGDYLYADEDGIVIHPSALI